MYLYTYIKVASVPDYPDDGDDDDDGKVLSCKANHGLGTLTTATATTTGKF